MLLDATLRTAGATLLLLTAAVLLRSAPRAPVARWFLPFALGVAGFLAVNSIPGAPDLPSPWWDVASFASRMAALGLWLFCLALFDDGLRLRGAVLAATLAWTALVVIDKEYFAPQPAIDLSALQIALGSAMLLHAGWRALRDLRGDLVESRRRARPWFALALLLVVAFDFAVDLLHGYGWRPATFVLWQNASIAALAAALAIWLLRAEPGLVAVPRPAPVAAAAPDPDAAVLARLEILMRTERPWLDPELTFAQFAARTGVAEPVLRRTINHRLGHGHFRSYLNAWRIEEAKRRLRDPAHAGDKIVAVALDSGFASLASFNRVFRQATGVAPSEFRGSPGGF